ncbi:hypothetical protein AM493_12390 [Flavobacterium akiainvivens]|uniref:Lipocalin-like domain-containing protein n=1 Tax=Flavobacterium akiainvivens TaxID=1202724 RepID=A0A0M8MJB7_9FLAO|nr:hypothetical protein [Flavobacterium akiainvivens]KOS06738.1 hypothetical protein AM493_12390 [Flavobacterium akiainvivens]SFQ74499.1 hypothetical protein SAMN05444144_12031 [Flavobacterium akiainvivens]
MKYLLLLLCFYCTAQAQECKITPQDVEGKWQLVAISRGFDDKGIEYANSTEFVTFTAENFSRTKDDKIIKSGRYKIVNDKKALHEGYCTLRFGSKTYKVIRFDADGFLMLYNGLDGEAIAYYKKVE